jgi:hypothetical protein
LIWIIATFLLVLAGIGIILQGDWWPRFALYGAVASLLAIIPWWRSVPPGAKIGVLYNVVILVVVLTKLLELVIDLIV